ncbi:hypothetical protein DPMN_079909 [Dreissena polymorpha]|uniref:C-type lectin domain-containing protein n=1 Tax=Dreissena polymorpha TaxID=45954 RepID=A0A9D3YVC7_DREPO|nr:hypothetical protein DPMN_079909 [Dreissena polymorpha]
MCLQYLNATIPHRVTQSVAEERCSGLGGLASFEHFNPPPGTRYQGHGPEKEVPEHLKRQLNELNVLEGESIWVSGIAEYGRFIGWQFCVNSLDVNTKTTPINDTDIHECSKKCSSKSTNSYFGIQQGLCYCLNRNPYFSNKSCTDEQSKSYIHIYVSESDTVADRTPFQCYLSSPERDFSDKCSAHHPAVCRPIDDKQTLNCPENAINNNVCWSNNSKNFVDHRNMCWRSNGRLYFREKDEYGFNSLFRTFEAVANQEKSDYTPCLTITRVGGSWWLEPDNCTMKRRYLCNNTETKNKFNGTENNANEIISNHTKSDEIDCTSKYSYYLTIVFILAFISGFAMIAVIVLGACLIRSCRMNTSMQSNVAQEMYEDLQSRNTAGVYSTVQETCINN